MLHNLALRRQAPFLQEDVPGDGLVAMVEPVDSEEEEAEDEDVDNRSNIIQHQHPCNGDQDVFEVLPDPQVLSLLQPLGLLQLGQYLAHGLLGMVVCSQDVGECLLESGFPGPVSAHQKKGIWHAIAKEVRTLGVFDRRSTHCRKRWEDLRRCAKKTAEAQLGLAPQQGRSVCRTMTP
ncbi:hypothetical protein NDU88_006930 [Pleurodeles waltl]|uniref:Myb/SANT-like DNA-binding domain-containing protein n=1 Tax=Pleurodeles waltl TaxID=8319 RepID=A0AAV7WFL7_PLEWA|nr:hypothetical protein NDU88_006930 [Pleurodeles waltl]